MEKLVLIDKNQFPDEKIIFSFITPVKKYWQNLFKEIHTKHPEFDEQWRYYNDGKSWLLKITKKKKTILWVSVFQDYFKTVFYFGDKAEAVILDSDISNILKEQFKNGKRYGKIRAIVISPASDNDIKDVMKIINIKLKIK